MMIQRESIADARRSGLEELQHAHWREVAVDQNEIPLSVDWKRYEELEQKGLLFALGMRDGSKLVGYNAFYVVPHLHYSTTIFAFNDVIYVAPEYRGLDGVRLILEAERQLAATCKADKVVYHSKDDIQFAAGVDGNGAADSLDMLDRLLEVEEEFGIELPDDIGGDDLTFGGLLVHLGYSKIESTYGKLLKGAQ